MQDIIVKTSKMSFEGVVYVGGWIPEIQNAVDFNSGYFPFYILC